MKIVNEVIFIKKITDHLKRPIHITYPPKKIVSLAPAITETLYHLSLNDEIVGRTRFCKYPKNKVEHALNVGGTKDIKLERIHSLKPDLIIAEKEENTKEIVETLEAHYPVFVFEVQSMADSLRMVLDLGQLVGQQNQAKIMHEQIENSFAHLPNVHNKRVAYMIWQRPYMVIGKDTYINSLLNHMGWKNPFIHFSGRYPEVTITDLKDAKLDYLLLATEPFPFQSKHIKPFTEMLPNVKTMIIDGEMFWYGAKAINIAPYFQTAFSDVQ